MIKEIIIKKCFVCNEEKIKCRETSFISLYRETTGKKGFNELFKTKSHDDINCSNCKKSTKHSENTFYSLTKSTQYVIIRLNLSTVSFNKVQRHEMKIDNFDPENIKIPGIDDLFILKSTILYEEISRYPISGHYTCQIRRSNFWFEISDISETKRNLNKHLANSFLLLLEKK